MKGCEGADELTARALEQGINPQEVISSGLLPGMERVGIKFRENKAFVPQVLMSAKAMSTAMLHLKPHFISGKTRYKGTYIIGTVAGDLHDIGKNLVIMLVAGNGYRVIDLGVDVSAERFVGSIKENPGAIVGLSALLTTTMINMENITAEIKLSFPGTLVTIGGAPVNAGFCKKIGADNYSRGPAEIIEFLNKQVLI